MLRTVMFGAFDAATYCMFFEAGFPDLFFVGLMCSGACVEIQRRAQTVRLS